MRLNILLVALVPSLSLGDALARPAAAFDRETFPPGIVLIGAHKAGGAGGSGIYIVSPDGVRRQTLYNVPEGFIGEGRVSRDRRRVASNYTLPDGKVETRVLHADKTVRTLCDTSGSITAWSPDGKQVAFYRSDGPGTLAAFTIDVRSRMAKGIGSGAEYVADDWHPLHDVRTLLYMNSRNRIYRKSKGDSYPTRQIDLMTSDGKRTPLTKDPFTDNIWSRFSPKGDRIAYYMRRIVGACKTFCVSPAGNATCLDQASVLRT